MLAVVLSPQAILAQDLDESAILNPPKVLPKNERLDLAVFADGSRLHGQWKSLENGVLTWAHPSARSLIEMDFGSLHSYRRSSPPSLPDSLSIVRFIDGSWLAANLKSLQGDKLQLEIPGAKAPFELPIEKIEWISLPGPGSTSFFDGTLHPSLWNEDGKWVDSEKGLEHLDFRSATMTAKLPPLAGKTWIDMEMSHVSPGPQWTLYLFAGPQGENIPGSLYLRFGSGYCYGRMTLAKGTHSFSMPRPEIDAREFGKPNRERWQMLVDRPGKKLTLYQGDKTMATWDLPEEPGSGSGAHLRLIPSLAQVGAKYELNRLLVRPWDGVIPGEPSTPLVLLKDGTVLRGNVSAIEAGYMQFSDDKGEGKRQLATPDISFIRFQAEKPELPPKPAGIMGILTPESGGVLFAQKITGAGDAIAIESSTGVTLNLGLDQMARWSAKNPLPAPAEAARGFLTLPLGDVLAGNPIELSSTESQLRWQPGGKKKPITFFKGDVLGMIIREQNAAPEPSPLSFRLDNGDWFTGGVEEWEDNRALIQSPLGQLTIDPRHLSSLFSNFKGQASIRVPSTDPFLWIPGGRFTPDQKWEPASPLDVLSTPGFRYYNGDWKVDGNLSRSLLLLHPLAPLPERFEILFRAEATVLPDENGKTGRAYPNLAIGFLSKDGGGGLYSNWGGNGVRVSARSPGVGAGLGERNRPLDFRLPQTEPSEFVEGRFCLDLREERVVCYYNGQFAGEGIMKGLGEILSKAAFLQLSAGVTGASSTYLRDFRLQPWSGIYSAEDKENQPETDEATKGMRRLSLTNGDYVDGTISAFEAGGLLLGTSLGEIKLPFERIAVMELTEANPDGPRVETATVPRIHLRSGGALTLQDYRLEADHLIATHPYLGSLRIPWSLVSELALSDVP